MSTLSTTPLSDLTVDYGTRPTMPALPDATDADRRMGRRLAAIHRMHLNDVAGSESCWIGSRRARRLAKT